MPAFLAAPTRVSWPSKSTLSIESPGWRERVDEAVEINADIPWQAARIWAGSFKSPMASSQPSDFNALTLSGLEVFRTSALTGLPSVLKRSQTRVPSRPVAPTTRIIVTSDKFHPLISQ